MLKVPYDETRPPANLLTYEYERERERERGGGRAEATIRNYEDYL